MCTHKQCTDEKITYVRVIYEEVILPVPTKGIVSTTTSSSKTLPISRDGNPNCGLLL